LTTLQTLKTDFEERFHEKWTSLSVQYHFKALVSKLFSLPFNQVVFQLSNSVDDVQLEIFHSYLTRLENNEPLQHIIEETEFMGFPIICSPAALIPRPETEELVELIYKHSKNMANQLRILDLCTGTGCIAIALKKSIVNSKVEALDNFDETIQLAEQNCRLNKVDVEIKKIDVLSEKEMKQFEENVYDIWVSNPPYIPEIDKKKMEVNVLDFEPHEALFVPDSDPLLFYRCISEQAIISLKQNGWLFFEIHENFGKEMIALLTKYNFKNISLIFDMQGKNRIVCGQK
jgi:release factor glutamine methyltransferase